MTSELKTPISSPALALFRSSIGKKTIMAVTGLIMLAFLLFHMLGNLKIFFGPTDFNHYAHWLRTIGEPVLHYEWFLWITRTVLFLALLLHIGSAAELSARDLKARPTKYAHKQRAQAWFKPFSMRWGGVALALFIVWHILDLTTGTVNSNFVAGHVYQNVYHTFHQWWSNVIYIVAMLCLGLHINHGFWSSAQTLGVSSPARSKSIKAAGTVLALVITAGFIMVPVGVMTGIVK